MANQINESKVVNAGGGAFYMARVLGLDAANISQASLSSISRLIVDTVLGQTSTSALVIADTVFDALQTGDARWTASGGSSTGYNFRDALPASAFPLQRKYTLQYVFTPQTGEVFKTAVLDVFGD